VVERRVRQLRHEHAIVAGGRESRLRSRRHLVETFAERNAMMTQRPARRQRDVAVNRTRPRAGRAERAGQVRVKVACGHGGLPHLESRGVVAVAGETLVARQHRIQFFVGLGDGVYGSVSVGSGRHGIVRRDDGVGRRHVVDAGAVVDRHTAVRPGPTATHGDACMAIALKK